MQRRHPTIVAHRGFHHEYPENSIESIAAAFRAGCSAVEFDVRLTADGVPVLLHDDTLDRMTSGQGHLAAVPWAEVQALRLRHKSRETDCKVCQFTDAYQPIADPASEGLDPKAWMFVVELKVHDRDLTRAVVESRNRVAGHVIVQSFDPRTIVDAVAIDPACDVAVLCGNADELNAAIAAPWKRLNLSHRLLTKELVTRLQQSGRLVGAWTANTEVELRGVISMGVDMIITDEPLLAGKLVAELHK